MRSAVSSKKKANPSSPNRSKAKAKAKQAGRSPKANGVTKPKATKPKATKPNNVSTEASTSTKTKRTNQKENINENDAEDLERGRRTKISTHDRLERDSLKIWNNPPKKRKATQDALEQEEDNDAAPPPQKGRTYSKTIPVKYMASPSHYASRSQQSQAFHRRSPSRSPTMSPPRLGRQYKHSYQVINSDEIDVNIDLQEEDDAPARGGNKFFGVFSDGIPDINAGSKYDSQEEDGVQSNNEEGDNEDEVEGEDDDDADDVAERVRVQREEDRQRRERRQQEQQEHRQQEQRDQEQGGKHQDGRGDHHRDDHHREEREDRRDRHEDHVDRREDRRNHEDHRDCYEDHLDRHEDREDHPDRCEDHHDHGKDRSDHREDRRDRHDHHRDRRDHHQYNNDEAHGGKRRGHSLTVANHKANFFSLGGGPSRSGDGQEDLDPDHRAHGKTASSHCTSSNHHPRQTGNKSGPSGNQKGHTGTDQGRDVLAQYRVKNRATRPPDPRKLAAYAQRQTGVEENSDADNNGDDDDEEEEEEETGPRRRRPRTATGVVTSLHEGFYPPFFRKTINITKIKAFEDLLNGYLFPDFDRLRPKILQWLIEAIHHCEDDLELIQPEGIWEEYQTDLTKLIWNFVSTFRGRCRDLSREVVPVLYKIRPSVDDFEGGFGQAEFADKMKDNVEKLLKDYNFLKHGVDAEGHTNNMMHPAISELIFRIIHKPHKSEDSLAKSLPEEFGVYTGELVAAVVLFLQVGLQEYATGQFLKVRFTEENYHKTYKDALRSIAKLKGNREHWGKTTARWAQWEAEHTIEVGTPNANAEGMVTLD
ncbi:hypothetical protein C8F04DRAFT_1091760 [Mycena alexandri]|uniref:DUF6532 domain-containing protein n=1 Tax=Mycena alexandri TaxID=1745969 RepID=A0AAD6X3G5_9AGAR|nr:hypothetical protein C8F04DRAFT_1091760 [Mycena alexandri]